MTPGFLVFFYPIINSLCATKTQMRIIPNMNGFYIGQISHAGDL